MNMFMFLHYRISMFFLLWFLMFFLPLKYSKRKSVAVCALCFVLCAGADWNQFFINTSNFSSLLITMIEIILVQGTAVFLCRYRDFRGLFTGIVSSAYVLSGNVCCSIGYLLSGSYTVGIIVQILVHSMLLWLLSVQIRGRYLEEMDFQDKGWGALCLIPALFYVTVTALAKWPVSIYETPDNCVGIIGVLILMSLLYILVVKLLSQQRRDYELKHDNELLENYARQMEHQAQVMLENENKASVLHHDMRHTATLIDSYLEENEKEKIREVITSCLGSIETVRPKRICKNLAVDGILSQYMEQAKKLQIQMECQADVPQTIEIDEFELATVLANLIENAVLAAAKVEKLENRIVKVLLKETKGQELMEISNTFQEFCEFSKETGLPISKNGEGHGYGLRSVRILFWHIRRSCWKKGYFGIYL